MTTPFSAAAAMGATSLVGTVSGLDEEEKGILNELWMCWTTKMRRNLLRANYYDQKNCLKDLGIGIPPHMVDLELVLGWPAKAVDVLARRCKLEQFTVTGSTDNDPLGIQELWTDNDMDMELPQAITSALVHSCSFLMVTQGDTSMGEPEVLISSQSALFGSGLWDYRLRRLRAAFSITNMNEIGSVTEFVLFLPKLTIRGKWNQKWEIERYPHTLDRLPVEVLPYKPRLDRPFGNSRISRAVMGLSDSAFRTMVRLESNAEFYSAPQRYVMGADEAMFRDAAGNMVNKWESIMGRVWALPRDENNELPEMNQFPANLPTPHTEQIRTLASLFCGETGLPLSALGIVHDNPASAEAIEAAERDLIIEARYAMDCFGPRLVRTIRTALEIRDGSTDIKGLAARWSAPENPPASAAADAAVKVVGAVPWLAETQIPFEMLDWDAATIQRAMSQKRSATSALVSKILTTQPQANAGKPAGTPVPAKPSQPPSQ